MKRILKRAVAGAAALGVAVGASQSSAAEPPADAIAALRQAVFQFCLPAVMTGQSVAQYAFGAGLEPVEKSLLSLNDDGEARYAWLFAYDGGLLVISEEGRAPAAACQVFMRRGDAAAAQRSIEKMLACPACYFEKDAAASVATRAARADVYHWRYGDRLIAVEAVRRLRRENRSDPIFYLTISASASRPGAAASGG